MDEKEIIPQPGLLLGNRPEDFFAGANSPIPWEPRNTTGNWFQFRSLEENQFNKKGDWSNCTNQSAENQWEAQANWALVNNLWPAEALDFWNREGYIVDGKFRLSTRFNTKLSGTVRGIGNYFYRAQDSLRKDGVVPEHRWPTTLEMSPEEYYASIPADVLNLGKMSLKYYDWLYEFLPDFSPKALDKHIQHAPVQIGLACCPVWSSGNIPVCQATPTHAVLIESVQFTPRYTHILDHYPPYSKRLDPGYNLYSACKGIMYPKGKNILNLDIVTPLVKDIEMWEKGPQVTNLKRVLKRLGWLPNYQYNPDVIDVYDGVLAQIIFNFQLANLARTFLEMILSLKGKRVGPRTRAVLNSYIKNF